MPRTKKRSTRKKKYNPQKVRTKILRQRAALCQLYRWERTVSQYGEFEATGPYEAALTEGCMQWAMSRPERWTGTVIACFVADNEDYYEELITLPPFGPVTLAEYAAEIDSLIQLALTEAKQSGNSNHFEDAMTVLQISTTQNEHNIEDVVQIKRAALNRVNYVFKNRKQRMIDNLSGLINSKNKI